MKRLFTLLLFALSWGAQGSLTITQQPMNQTVSAGQTATISVTTNSTNCRSVLRKNGSQVSYGPNPPTSTTINLTTPALAATDSGSAWTVDLYGCMLSGEVISNAAIVTVTTAPPPPPAPFVWTMPGLGTATFPMNIPPACGPSDGQCSIQIQVCDTSQTPPVCMTSSQGTITLLKNVTLPTPQVQSIPLVTVTPTP